MKIRLAYIERRLQDYVSIERVFNTIASCLPESEYTVSANKLPFGSGIGGILQNLAWFRPVNADIWHITGHVHFIALLFPGSRTILTIHDLAILHNSTGIRRYFLKKLFLDWPVRKVGYITAISQATKDDIVSLAKVPPERIRVIENPVTIAVDSESESKAFNSNKPTILQIGTAPHKNLENLIEAISDIPCRLEIVGKITEKQLDMLRDRNIEYAAACNLDDKEMLRKYLESDLLSFCSTFEGFGLPIVEGQAVGVPVITSDLEPMRSVAGKGACLVDPFDLQSFKSGLLKLISNSEYRNKIIDSGFQNAKRFEPKGIAAKYDSLYKEVFANAFHDKKESYD